MKIGLSGCIPALVLSGVLALAGCTEHASEADKAAAAQAAAARQQQIDEAAAVRKTIPSAEQQLAQLPPPAKGRYLQVRSAEAWSNPFLVVSRKTITLRIVPVPNSAAPNSGLSDVIGADDTLPHGVLPNIKLRPSGQRKQEMTLRFIDLPVALAALPQESWPYGRVVAVEEDPATPKRERPLMRRNLEAVFALLNDLDVVADEWPYGQR